MDIKQGLINELSMEAASTRKILERIPAEKFDWKPHEKSMSIKNLALHMAQLSGWPVSVVTTDELDIATADMRKPEISSTQEILDMHEKAIEAAVTAIRNMPEEDLLKPWTFRRGEQIYFQMPKIAVLRGMCYNHVYHHRGQLTVYLRLLDIKVPGMYGPTADEA